jgi:hypothetical protein
MSPEANECYVGIQRKQAGDPKPVTIGEHMDQRIADARKNVEKLCVTKAKLEALNVLDHEIDLYAAIIFG